MGPSVKFISCINGSSEGPRGFVKRGQFFHFFGTPTLTVWCSVINLFGWEEAVENYTYELNLDFSISIVSRQESYCTLSYKCKLANIRENLYLNCNFIAFIELNFGNFVLFWNEPKKLLDVQIGIDCRNMKQYEYISFIIQSSEFSTFLQLSHCVNALSVSGNGPRDMITCFGRQLKISSHLSDSERWRVQ